MKAAPDTRRALRLGLILALGLIGPGIASVCLAQTAPDMMNTKHNLSASGPGPIRAMTETRICVFCHTPHSATPLTPLWNKDLEPQVYSVYASPTLKTGPLSQPSGASKLCLSCHDGTIAMGAVVNPAGGIGMAGGGTIPPGSLSDFGLNLSGHHPVSFAYPDALPNPELSSSPPPDLVYGGGDEVHCNTCHDPHNDQYGRFLVKDNRYSALCITCHQLAGWAGSAHATSTAPVAGNLPRPPKTWPTWTQLNEWGCEVCHTPHFAATAEGLLNLTDAPPTPFGCTSAGCHSGEASGASPPLMMADVASQIRKISAHRDRSGMIRTTTRGSARAARSGIRGVVACADCHNPHVITGRRARPPYVSGLLQGVRGVDRNGAEIGSVVYEYEVCFRCHGDFTPDLDYIYRVLDTTNTRLAFDPTNESYHPVVAIGRNQNIPSIPSAFEPSMTASDRIYCSACHADDQGVSRGPHGSSFPPILRQRYEMADHTPESQENYALCYHCHDRSSILRDDSFKRSAIEATGSGGGHSGHLAAGATCSACHDPHGVNTAGALGARDTGSHTHLINFDTLIVLPAAGERFPVFHDKGMFTGGCTLVCHGVAHDGTSYP